MTYISAGRLGVRSAHRDELVEHLTRASDVLRRAGCLRYDVGIDEEDPDHVYVAEEWESAAQHRASLQFPEVRASIAEVSGWLTGDNAALTFDKVGSPLE